MPIPTFNPGTPNVDLTQIRRFNPAGDQAAADMWGSVSNEMAKVSSTFGEIEARRVMAEQEQLGKVAGAENGFDPSTLGKAVTQADMAFRKGAIGSYMARLDIDTNQAFTTINAESFEDPALLRRRMENYVDAQAGKMPVDVAIDYKQGALRSVDAFYSNSVSSAASRARSQQKDDIQAGIELSERRLKELGVPTNPASQAAYELEAAKLKVKQQNAIEAGVMTPNQIAVREQVLKEDLEDGTIYEAVMGQPGAAKMDFAMKVAEGKSGTGLDLLPPDRRIRAVTVAQQFLNAEKAQEDLAEKTQTRVAEQTIWNASELVAANPTDPRARAVVGNLMSLANTPETVNQVGKLRSYIANPNDARFAASNREYLDYLQLEAARGSLTQQQVDTAWGNDSANTRISTADRQQLSQLIKVKPKGILGTNAWDTFVGKLETEFPVRERRRTGMNALFASLGLNIPSANGNAVTANGLSEGQMKANEGLVKQVLLETQEKISKGDIASEASLTDYGAKKIAELRQFYQGAAVDKANRPLVMSPAKQGAYMTVKTQPTMDQLYAKYKNDRDGFARDAASGQLDVKTINTINRMLEGE